MRVKRFLLFLCVPCAIQAKDLGTWGEMYPIAEPDMLTTIHDRLQALNESGALAQQNEAFKKRVIEHTLRPTPVPGMTLARENRTHYVDLSFVVSQDIADQQGRVFAHKGQVVNPLEHVPFQQTLYFIDGDNAAQLAWMKSQYPTTLTYRIILVNGDVRKTTQALGERIFFDQNGTLSRKFGLTAVPARITLAPDKTRLQVDTIALTSQGDAP